MAWYKRFRVPFQSFDGTQYMVYIYEKTSGSLVTLTGAPEPFVTQEESDTDVFRPIRPQTGYIRIRDLSADGSLLETLIPENNTQKLVRLYTGTWNNDYTVFTDGDIMWQGFLVAEAYTQPWDNQKNIIELPVASLLSVLRDVRIPDNFSTSDVRIAKLITEAFNDMDVLPEQVAIISNLSSTQADLLKVYSQRAAFYEEHIINNQGDSYQQIDGMSFSDVFQAIASLYGMCFREAGSTLALVMYDKNGGRIMKEELTWSDFVQISNGNTVSVEQSALQDVVLPVDGNFRGTENQAGYTQGGRTAQITLQVTDNLSLNINLPQTTEDASIVYQIEDIAVGDVFVQPHSPRSNSIESFTFSEYQQSGQTSSRIGSSNYQNCLENSVIFRPLYDPQFSSQDNLHTGAFPCRWYYRENAQSQPMLKNGLFINMQYLKSGQNFTPYWCYSIQSSLGFTLQDGYINIDMLCNSFIKGQLVGDSNKLYFGDYNTIWGTKPATKLYCILTWGTKEWDGTQWVTHSGNYNTFMIEFDGVNIKSNKTADMSVDRTGGWFIPVTEQMTGRVTLYILNVGSTETELGFANAHSRIISDLSVEFIPNVDIASSRRSQNVYRQTIMQSGFGEDKEKTLTIGTMNNNVVSTSFIKRSSSEFIETLTYLTAGGTANGRPEINLLSRMVTQYNQVRRMYRAVLASGLELITCRYTYNGRKYFAVDAQHNWRDDIQEVKFIEVT